MAGPIVLVFLGVLCGVIVAMVLMSFVVEPTLMTDPKSLGDVSNLVMAAGAVFSLGFSLWQHQQTLVRDKKHSQPRMRLVGAPIQQVSSARRDMVGIAIEFQL